jgi:fumarate reductase flavoprotein subunit
MRGSPLPHSGVVLPDLLSLKRRHILAWEQLPGLPGRRSSIYFRRRREAMSSEEKEPKLVSRRGFIKGAAVGVAAVSGGGLLASCAPKQAEATPAATAQASGTASTCKIGFETPPAPIPADQIKETASADVVIIGAGVSGLMAALSAAEAGAKTILIEKSEKYNARGGHNAAINSKIMQQEGLKYEPGQVVRDITRWSGNKSDSALVMLWANKCSEIMDYMIDLAEKNNIKILRWGNDIPTAYYPEYKTVHMFGGMDQTILAGMLEKTAKEKGAEFRYSTPAVQLVRADNKGRVTGVIAKNAKGEYVQINASKGVILATGDYGHNDEMIARYCPIAKAVDVNVYAPPVNTGDGHLMGLWVGAAMQDDEPHAPMVHNLGAPPFSGNPFLRVNLAGKRYENEDVPIPYMANSIQRQAQHKTWTVYDSTYEEDLPKMGTSFSRTNAMSDMTKTSMENALKAGTALFKADTLDELAQKMGVPADAFKATVARYNDLAKKGKDEDFGKDPAMMTAIDTAPFYAAYNSLALLVVVGGLKVNTDLQVIDTAGNAIPGLYASGNTVGGFFSNDYAVIVPGCSHSRAWTFGRIAGQNVAKASA